MPKLKVLAASSGRADIGIIGPVWRAVARDGQMRLDILLTGMHIPDRGAASVAALPPDARVHIAGADMGGAGAAAAAAAMAVIQKETAELIAEIEPDILLVVGDRLDILPVVLATLPFNTPVGHIGGGDLTLGAIDERVRHALTKLSHVHFVLNSGAAERIARMGEETWRIHLIGAPNLDTLVEAPRLSAAEFAAEVGLPNVLSGIRLVTVHPETNSADPGNILQPILDALDAVPAPTLITASNADPGGEYINRALLEFVGRRPWAVYRDTLGGRLYANAIRHCALMLGNSSSGIIEAGLFDMPVINVGSRQEGRLRGSNVHDVAADAAAIAGLLSSLGREPNRAVAATPYGDGKAAARILEILQKLPERSRLLHKQFSISEWEG